jgi:hypothetical protein
MIAALPTQEQVDQIARSLAPDVVHIRINVTHDWAGDPAIYFRVLLSDEASRRERLAEVAERVRRDLSNALRLDELEHHHPYFRFRSQSEQAALKGKLWD